MRHPWILVGLLAVGAAAQPSPPRPEARVPPGRSGRGSLVMRRSGCLRCHQVPGLERPTGRGARWLSIPLTGASVSRLSDRELVTQLISPEHRTSPGRMNWDEPDPEASPMPSFARSLSLRDLADLVAFLRKRIPRPRYDAARAESSTGLAIPLPEGDKERGRRVFQSRGCTLCHVVSGEVLPLDVDQPPMRIMLGGSEAPWLGEGDLATEIADPSAWVTVHRLEGREVVDAESPMPDMSRHLSVQDLADLAAFLAPAYMRPKR